MKLTISLSLHHHDHPYHVEIQGEKNEVAYWPGDSKSGMVSANSSSAYLGLCQFGGNSNWRGPIWLAVNFLLIESLQRFHQYFGDSFTAECPTGSGDVSYAWRDNLP